MDADDERLTDWGASRRTYYGGDTADLEIGQKDEDAVEEEALARAMPSGRKRGQAAIYNEAALLLKLEQMTGGVDTDTDDKAWLETLAVTAPEPLEVDDAEDDIKRELAL